MSILSLCGQLEATGVGVMVRESMWGFPVIVAIHILGLTCSVGVLLWFDLRLLGLGLWRLPVSEVYRRLMPWMAAAFTAMFVSGGLLFVGFATKAYGNLYFRIKLGALALAAVNALVFHLMTERQIGAWDTAPRPPIGARLAGLVSILAWGTVIAAGRMMSYTMF
jgi:uncharacterized protein DUF6644